MEPIAAPAATPATTVERDSQAWRTAQEFEAVFLAEMLGHMYRGIAAGAPFGGGFAEETYRALLHQEIGRQMAAGGGVGIAEAVYAEMIRLQGEPK
jgi:Rod binding domain-containing protein